MEKIQLTLDERLVAQTTIFMKSRLNRVTVNSNAVLHGIVSGHASPIQATIVSCPESRVAYEKIDCCTIETTCKRQS